MVLLSCARPAARSLRAAPFSPQAAPCGPLAAPCSPVVARLLPLSSPLAALWQPARRLFAALAPPSGSPLAALLQPARRPFAARVPTWLLPALPCPARFPSARAPPCPRAVLLVARHPALLAMASLSVLTFDHEGHPIQFDTWLDDLQVYLLSDSRDSVSLFDHTSGASLAPPATVDSATRSQWLTRDAATRLAVRNHLPLAERAHFGQHKTDKAMYDAVVARYSSPASAALGRLILPYLIRAALPTHTATTVSSATAVTTATVPAVTAAIMATPSVLTFDTEGRPIKFEVWLDDLHLFLQITAKDDVSLYDHTSGATPAPPATADSTARSQWQTRDAHARLAVRSHLPLDEREHFGQHKTAKEL
ncbi:unnamed protein product [Closterium sp. NIES-53]